MQGIEADLSEPREPGKGEAIRVDGTRSCQGVAGVNTFVIGSDNMLAIRELVEARSEIASIGVRVSETLIRLMAGSGTPALTPL